MMTKNDRVELAAIRETLGEAIQSITEILERPVKKMCPACYETYEIKKGHACPYALG
jgi:hypothetical protein